MIADQDGPNIPKTKRIPDYSASLIPRWAVDISLRVRPQRFAALPQIAQRGISETE
jgi:hypothetical protein